MFRLVKITNKMTDKTVTKWITQKQYNRLLENVNPEMHDLVVWEKMKEEVV